VGNIKYDALDNLRGNFLHLFEKDDVPINGWDEIIQEPTEHEPPPISNWSNDKEMSTEAHSFITIPLSKSHLM
jgi:hypothetical protein